MKALLIIAQEGYQEFEYGTPKKILQQAGIEVVTAALKKGRCSGSLGGSVEADVSLDEVNVSDYDAIVFIGGPGSAKYQHLEQAHSIARETLKQNKILAAICLAPTIIAYAGVLKGKKATVWNGNGLQQKILESHGAIYVNQNVVIDGKIITANGPAAAEKFGLAILGELQ